VSSFACDEDFNNRILRGLQRELTDFDPERLQDKQLNDRSDPAVLDWCAENNRILLTHDVNTITKFAYERIRERQDVPGIVAVHQTSSIGKVIEDLCLLINVLNEKEFENKIIFVPLN